MRKTILIQTAITTTALLILYHQLTALTTLPKLTEALLAAAENSIPGAAAALTPIIQNYNLITTVIIASPAYKAALNGKSRTTVTLTTITYTLTLTDHYRILDGIQTLSKTTETLVKNLRSLLTVNPSLMPPTVSLAEGITLITLYIAARETEKLHRLTTRLTRKNYPPKDISQITEKHLLFLALTLTATASTLALTLATPTPTPTAPDTKTSLALAILLLAATGITTRQIYIEHQHTNHKNSPNTKNTENREPH